MPQPPTLSLSNFLNSASSSRRKRSHAEITRSQSRSLSPPLPHKRRRVSSYLGSSQHPFSPSPTASPTPSPASTRFPGDGFDYRRPIMSQDQPRSHPTMNPTRTAIDLTIDSDSSTESDTPIPAPRHSQSRPRRRQTSHASRSERGSRASHMTTQVPEETHEVIDLSDDSDFHIQEFDEPAAERRTRRPTPFEPASSPEVEIVHERPAPVANRRVNSERPERHERPRLPPIATPPLPTGQPGPFGYFPDIIRRSTQLILGNLGNTLQNTRDTVRQIHDEVRRRPGNYMDNPGDLIINFDYRQAGFQLGGFDMQERTSETPQVVQEPYKAPPAAKEGFIRTFTEESVVLCPMCGDELATGDNETKQQVWVVKGCGHVYCGECAVGRHITKPKKEKKAVSTKSMPFKICAIEGCDAKVTSKQAMFPVYL
ncbi:hypothetical protein LTR84_007093 [Exophiala bonariae]|uniref:RING-type domain-containing protein n=1 Tax=Exophiala bonariae TaxID=1690606 RepID=A0AAV9MZJ8_9EURO|nr:hypothetical protein LTR84_007093 [Exophiala bonariae]